MSTTMLMVSFQQIHNLQPKSSSFCLQRNRCWIFLGSIFIDSSKIISSQAGNQYMRLNTNNKYNLEFWHQDEEIGPQRNYIFLAESSHRAVKSQMGYSMLGHA
uniref:Uncharacterized protein n=1 Tax=Arundo donax TaxID=35708 RepID=A0A0A9B7X0_ARUDO